MGEHSLCSVVPHLIADSRSQVLCLRLWQHNLPIGASNTGKARTDERVQGHLHGVLFSPHLLCEYYYRCS